jgi:guanine deaminase
MLSTMKIIRGQIIDFGDHVSHFTKGALVVGQDGRVDWLGEFVDLPPGFKNIAVVDHDDKILVPGFVDAHIHFPQYRMLAAPAKDLLEWLRRFTFPEESKFGNPDHVKAAAQIFLNRLFSNGTTSAMAFCSVHRACADGLFAAALDRNMALITGKTMMDRNAVPDLQDTAETGARDTADIHKKWHGKSRLLHAVTPRFAVTSTEEQLKLSGELLASLPDARMQTHLSESASEIAFIKQLYPWAKDYTDVYDHFGLLGPRSHFAHGIHLSDREVRRLTESGSSILHCPTSNNFLGSGLMSMARYRQAEIRMGLATDVGGGTSYSMLATMAEAYKVQMLNGLKLSATELFGMATGGNAQLIGLSDTGSLAVGQFADIVVLDPRATPVLKARQELSESLEDTLFSLMMLSDDRAITATYVAGQKVYDRVTTGL